MEDNVEQIIVVTAPGRVSTSTAIKLRKQIAEVFPGRKLIILEEGMTLDVVYSS